MFETITKLLKKLAEIVFCINVCDPPLQIDPKMIGQKVNYNALKHDPFDGFIKNKEECIIILPSVHKT